MRLRTWLLSAAILAGVLGASLIALRTPAVLAFLFDKAARARLAQLTAASDLFDGKALRVILCGTSSPLADADRAKSCVVVVAGDRAYVVDAGPESWKTLALMGFPAQRIAAVMLTHYHSDHIGGLGEFRLHSWIAGRKAPLPVHGPPGVERVVDGVNATYALDDVHRSRHHGEAIAPLAAAPLVSRPFAIGMSEAGDEAEVVLERDGLTVTAFDVNHAPVRPAVGYRFDYRGRSVVISGDTARSDNLVKRAAGADLLIHEAQSARMLRIMAAAAAGMGHDVAVKILGDIESYHATPADAGAAANAAGVKLLVLTHLSPPAAGWFWAPLFVEGLPDIRPRSGWVMGADGMRFDLPAGDDAIVTSPAATEWFR